MCSSLVIQTSQKGPHKLDISSEIIKALLRQPSWQLATSVDGIACRIKIIYPHYTETVYDVYGSIIDQNLDYYYTRLGLPPLFPNYGLTIKYEEPVELMLHDDDMVLLKSAKDLLKIFGVLIIKNAYLHESIIDMGHRNRFPQLNFHVDRIESQQSYYSVYTRNPFDVEQVKPRTSSTLFIPTLVGYLQGLVEGKEHILSSLGIINNAVLFDPDTIQPYLNRLIVQHAWNEPDGVGEISMINNCNMLHASYYPNIHNKGYRIGVRYLA